MHEFAKMQAHVRCTRCQLRSCLQVALPRLLPCSPLLFADCLCPPNWLDVLSKWREVGNQTFVLVYASHRHTLLCPPSTPDGAVPGEGGVDGSGLPLPARSADGLACDWLGPQLEVG